MRERADLRPARSARLFVQREVHSTDQCPERKPRGDYTTSEAGNTSSVSEEVGRRLRERCMSGGAAASVQNT